MSFRDFSPKSSASKKGLPVEGSNNNGQRQPSPLHNRSTSASNNRPIPMQHFDSLQYSRSKSDSTYQNHFSPSYIDNIGLNNDNNNIITTTESSLLIQQREEEYAMQVMQEREGELKDIHHKMNVVNEIYKDLGEVVSTQGEQIDQLETQFGRAAESTRKGCEQISKANIKASKKVGKKGGEEEEGTSSSDKRQQFFLFRYLQKSANEISKLVSVCGGSGSANYVDESWTTNTRKNNSNDDADGGR